MKRSFAFLLFALSFLMLKTAAASTFYVRADGGTRYSSNATSGQCDGLADAAYPGQGINQHCAYNDVRFLWDDQNSYNQLNWAMKGGDTVIIDNSKQWRIGWDSADGSNEPWCLGGDGTAPYGCRNPTIPAGTAAQHTRILGRNYANCSAGNQPDKTKLTQIFGGHGLWSVLNLTGAQYVDVQCIEITRHSDCMLHGSPNPKPCHTSFPVDDYDSDGIGTDTNTHDVLLQDMWIHGHTDRGILGPIGGLMQATRVDIDTNGMAGWDLDQGDGTPSPNGDLRLSYVTIQWSGCNQEYPAVHAIPVSYCYSQSSGGYGDGIGTPQTPMVGVSIDHSIFRYNTQDGEDFGHVLQADHLIVTNSASYANSGGQWKWAGFTNVTFENNVAIANCLRMSQPLSGTPSTYNAYLGDFCRAQDAISFAFNNHGSGLIANNSFISYAPTTFDVQCYDDTDCSATTINMNNNIVLGYVNQTTWNMGGREGGVGGFCGAGCNSTSQPVGVLNRANNIYYGIRGSCIANQLQAAARGSVTGESCLDPQFVNEPSAFTSEASLDGFNFALSSSSPARSGGTNVLGLTTDYLGKARLSPTSVGALEYGSLLDLNSLYNWVIGTLTTTPTTPTTVTSPTTTPTTPTTPTTTDPTKTTSPTTTSPTTTSPTTTPTSKGPYPTAVVLTATRGKNAANPLLLTAAVTPTATNKGAVQGMVILYNASKVAIGKSTLDATGKTSWQVPAALIGQVFFGVYQGNATYLASTSASLNSATALASLK